MHTFFCSTIIDTKQKKVAKKKGVTLEKGEGIIEKIFSILKSPLKNAYLRLHLRSGYNMSNHIMSNHNMSKNKMSNSQNVESQNVEFT